MKTAVITGASKGIGLAIAENLLSRDYKVYAISRSKPEIKHEHLVWIECNLYDVENIDSALNQISENNIDALICNAGTASTRLIKDLTIESYKETFDLNVLSPIIIVQKLHEKIQQAFIVSISSVSDRISDSEFSLYCASKAAITRFFEALAKELPNARVFSILPTYVDTPLLRTLHSSDGFNFDEILKPNDISGLVEKLEADELGIESGSNVMIVNTSTIEDLESSEVLYGYIADTQTLKKLS